jgi:hypothetical protein
MRDLIEGNMNKQRRPSGIMDKDGMPKRRSSMKSTDSTGIADSESYLLLEKQLNESKEQVLTLTEQLARTQEAGVNVEGGDEVAKNLNKDSMYFR